MSEQSIGPDRDRLDRAIEQTVRRLVSRDAPADLRARVLEQLSGPGRARWAWTPQRLALAGAAVALAGALVLILPRWLEQTAAPRPESQTAGGVPAQSASVTPRQLESRPPSAGPAEATPHTPLRPRSTRTIEAAMTARPEGFVAIDPLPAPDPITIEPLASDRVADVPLDIAPLQFEPVRIEPLPVSR